MNSSAAVESKLKLYVSQLVGSPVKGGDGRVLGKLKDIVARVEDSPAPVVNGLILKVGGELLFVHSQKLELLRPGLVRLGIEDLDSRPFERRPGEILLARDLQDKEVVHVEGKRVVRANDVVLEFSGGRWAVEGVDISTAALLSQLGLSRLLPKQMKHDVLAWDELEMFAGTVPVPLRLTHDKISRLHPSDIAKVFQELGYRQSSELLSGLPDAVAADVMEDLPPEYQATLLSSLERGRAADILEEMMPDAAADVLNDIVEDDPDAAEEMVSSMEREDAAVVQRLQAYRDDTAGGLMTTEFVSLPPNLTAQQAIQRLRDMRDDLPHVLDPIVIVPEVGSRQIVGTLSLRCLVLANPDDLIESLMKTEVVVRHVDDSAREAARTIAHYNLVGLPILDNKQELVGLIQINEAMDTILPKEWLHRMPRPFIGGRSLG